MVKLKTIFASLSRKKRILMILLGILLIFTLVLTGSWAYHRLSYPEPTIYYQDFFTEEINSWKMVDGSWEKENGIVTLSQKEYATPYLSKQLTLAQSPTGDYVWHLRFQFQSFTDKAITLGTLILPTGEAAIVLNNEGELGIAQSLFDPPVYNTNPLETLDKGRWYDIYALIDSEEQKITLYNQSHQMFTTSFKVTTSPVQEIWLGTIWLKGAGSYGAPLGLSFDEVAIGNKGILSKPSFIAYTTNTIKKIWNKE